MPWTKWRTSPSSAHNFATVLIVISSLMHCTRMMAVSTPHTVMSTAITPTNGSFHRQKLLKNFGSALPDDFLDGTPEIPYPLDDSDPSKDSMLPFQPSGSEAHELQRSQLRDSRSHEFPAEVAADYGNRFGFQRVPNYRIEQSRSDEDQDDRVEGDLTREQIESDIEDNLRREFVRVQMGNPERNVEYRYQRKTYSIPRQFECFSCMSLSYEENWEYLQNMYAKPETFTNRCNEPLVQRNIPTVLCGTVCVTLLEPNVEAGVFLGYKYIRGCEDQVLRHGFNQTALRTHRFIFMDKQCKSLSRASLFNRPRQSPSSASFYGEVQLCTCFGNRCNGATRSAAIHPILMALIVFWSLARHLMARSSHPIALSRQSLAVALQ